jgi:hypothetical protein
VVAGRGLNGLQLSPGIFSHIAFKLISWSLYLDLYNDNYILLTHKTANRLGWQTSLEAVFVFLCEMMITSWGNATRPYP